MRGNDKGFRLVEDGEVEIPPDYYDMDIWGDNPDLPAVDATPPPPAQGFDEEIVAHIQGLDPAFDQRSAVEVHARRDEQILEELGYAEDWSLWQGTHVEIAMRVILTLERKRIIPQSFGAVTYRELQIEARRAGIVTADGSMWRYDEHTGVWCRIADEDVSACVTAFDGVPYGPPRRNGDKVKLHMTAGVVESVISILTRQTLRSGFFDSPRRDGLAVGSGYWIAEHGRLREVPHDRWHTLRYAYPVNWKEHPAIWENLRHEALGDVPPLHEWWKQFCPIFITILGKILSERDDEARCIQEWTASSLSGQATQMQKAILLLGEGGNGKGTLLKAIAQLFPPGSVRATNPAGWKQDYHRSALIGALLNVVTEASAFDGPDMLKAVITGDAIETRLTGRDSSKPFSYTPIAAHAFSANALPSTRLDKAIEDRFIVISCDRRFRGTGAQLKEAQILAGLRQELAGILFWVAAGLARLSRTRAITVPERSEALIARWKRESSDASRFAEEWLEPASTPVLCQTVYEAFRRWCDAQGIMRIPQQKDLTEAIKGQYPVERIGKHNIRHYSGCALKKAT